MVQLAGDGSRHRDGVEQPRSTAICSMMTR
jgi:hypothetical protein